jgi:hypothetical protein
MEQVSVASRQVSATAQQIAIAAGGQAEMAGELQIVASANTDQAAPPQPPPPPEDGRSDDGVTDAVAESDPPLAVVAAD